MQKPTLPVLYCLQACAFRDEYNAFVDAGAAVFGISSDSPAENAAFAKSQNLQYPLLTDENAILRKASLLLPPLLLLPLLLLLPPPRGCGVLQAHVKWSMHVSHVLMTT